MEITRVHLVLDITLNMGFSVGLFIKQVAGIVLGTQFGAALM